MKSKEAMSIFAHKEWSAIHKGSHTTESKNDKKTPNLKIHRTQLTSRIKDCKIAIDKKFH